MTTEHDIISEHNKCLIALTEKRIKKALKISKKVNKTHKISQAKYLHKLLQECVDFASIDIKILEN